MCKQLISEAKDCLFCTREKCGVACPMRRRARDTVYRLLQNGLSESNERLIGVRLWSMLGYAAPVGETREEAPGHGGHGPQLMVLCPNQGKPWPQVARAGETHCSRCCAAREEETTWTKKDI